MERQATGTARAWARDLAIIGGVASVTMPISGTPFIDAHDFLSYIAVTGTSGTATGAILGAAMPTILRVFDERVPLLVLLLFFGPLTGALWGGVVGALAIPTLNNGMAIFSPLTAAIGGMLQFGLWWFPYLYQTRRNASVFPIVALACFSAPILGWATVLSVIGMVVAVVG